MRLVPRLVLVLVVLVASHSVYAFFRTATPYRVRPPARDVNELPVELGRWVCSESPERDVEAEGFAGADLVARRVYAHADEQVTVTAQVAIWTRYSGHFLPGEPVPRYERAGCKILDTSEVQLRRSDGSMATARLLQAERQGQSVQVLFWYQLEQQTLDTAEQIKEIRWTFKGKWHWPPLVQVTCEVTGTDTDSAKQVLADLAEHILAWTSTNL